MEAEIDALRTTGESAHGDRALAAFAWFTGRNRLGLLLHDPATGGCCDGLTADSVNVNQGAESTLVYLSARLALEEAGLPGPGNPRAAEPEGSSTSRPDNHQMRKEITT